MIQYRIVREFNTWTEILNYLSAIDSEYKKNKVKYSNDIYYNEELDQYKVCIKV